MENSALAVASPATGRVASGRFINPKGSSITALIASWVKVSASGGARSDSQRDMVRKTP